MGLNLRTISDLQAIPQSENDVSLSEKEKIELENLAHDSYKNLRFDFSDERKNFAKWTADKILQRIHESQSLLSTASPLEYINRENAYAHRGGCIFQNHHLPKWAKNDPKNFFKAAYRYEGRGNRRYVEIEFALPNELKTVDQFRQIIEPFIHKHLKNHYYAYAIHDKFIHDKFGALSNQHHPHVHIMFSERLIDEIEKIKERSACNFFKYPARRKKDDSPLSFKEKFKRGAVRDRKWGNHQPSTINILPNFVLIVLNFKMKSYRSDHRSLLTQKAAAEQDGDKSLAKLFDRIPEKYIGLISCKDLDDSKLERLKEFRALRQHHFDLILKMDSLTKESEELDIKDDVQFSSTNAKKLIDSKEFLMASPDLKSQIFSAIAEVNKWKRIFISFHDAQQQAKLEYMTKSERELWQQYQETLAQKNHLQDFLQTLRKPDDLQKEALNAYDDIVSGVKKKIFAIITSSALMKKSVAEIEKKLETPDCKNNILLVTHQILHTNLHARKMLKLASENLNRSVDELQNKLFSQTSTKKNIFKTREVFDILHRQFFTLKKEYEKNLDVKADLQHKIFSPQRVSDMAKNIFVHGGFKKLRSDYAN